MNYAAALLLLLGAEFALAPSTPAAAALVSGALIALIMGNPWQSLTRTWTHRLLPLAVVGLGADMNLRAVAKARSLEMRTTSSISLVLRMSGTKPAPMP